MSIYNCKVELSPLEVSQKIKAGQTADLIYEEFLDLGQGKYIGTLIFEKYYMRTKNRAALTVIFDNLKGHTDIRSIAAGSSQSMFFSFDWGAADEFAGSIKKIFRDYIIK